jgi:branched-subunit amino acid transport protein AzlD
MNTQLTLGAALIATIISTLIICGTRAFPFVLFSRRDPPRIIKFIEKYIPPMVMAILVIYCLKDIQITVKPYSLPSFIALGVTVALHLWKHNPLISISGGTILFMILERIM